ncbi:MAG: undecaprenyl-diphosphate phosphatase [Parcubacteria group bacterium]
MTLFHAIILGLIQGFGEFLPISSSGHLILAPWLLNFPDPGLSFDVALHFGTLIAVVLYFWKDFLEIICIAFSSSPFGRGCRVFATGEGSKYNKNIFWLLVIATIPGALFGFLLESKAETIFRNPLLIAGTLSIVGLILYLADKYASHKRNINELTKKDATLIGLSQAFAIIPGVSRAGATITTGLFLGLDRVSAARFSFLLSAPIILGATLVKIKYIAAAGTLEIVAILTAALSGYFAISWMLKFIERVSYKVFFWYRLALAVIIVLVWFLK